MAAMRPDHGAEQACTPNMAKKVGGIHAEHHEVALGEIDHPHDAEDRASPTHIRP
jgi:hypothetical protein